LQQEAAEAAALKACGDELFAEWRARIGAQASFAPYINEAEMAMLAARSYYGHALRTEDFAGGLAAVRAVIGLSQERFPARHEDYKLFHTGLDQLEDLLMARAGERNPSRSEIAKRWGIGYEQVRALDSECTTTKSPLACGAMDQYRRHTPDSFKQELLADLRAKCRKGEKPACEILKKLPM
jgi:hypothetical protein